MHERREAQVGAAHTWAGSGDSFTTAAFRLWNTHHCGRAWVTDLLLPGAGRPIRLASFLACSDARPWLNGNPRPRPALQEARKSEEEKAKEQEQAANAYLHLNSYLALPAPGQDGGQAGYGGAPAYGMPPQF